MVRHKQQFGDRLREPLTVLDLDTARGRQRKHGPEQGDVASKQPAQPRS